MPTVHHPRALERVDGHTPASVTVNGDSYPVEGGTVKLPTAADVRTLAEAYGLDADDLREDDDGGDCPHCDEYDGDHVAQHVAQAHPDAE